MIPDLFHPSAAPFRLEGSNGEAVVLLHGFTGVPTHFRPMATFLNEHGYTVNVPLLAGHGTSIEHMAETDHRDWRRSAELATEAVSDHRRVHLVGLSMGGLLGIRIAAQSAASTVTTINSPLVVRNARLYLAPLASRAVPKVVWGSDDGSLPPDDVAEFDLTYQGFHTSNARDLLRTMLDGYRWARRLRRPALVIQSRADESVHPSSGRILASALGPDCRLLWLENARHNALLDPDRHTIHQAVLERCQPATSD